MSKSNVAVGGAGVTAGGSGMRLWRRRRVRFVVIVKCFKSPALSLSADETEEQRGTPCQSSSVIATGSAG